MKNIQAYIEKKQYIKQFPDSYVQAQKQVKRLKENFENYPKIVQLLLKNGADTKLKNNNGNTPLMLARKNNTDTMVKILKNYRYRIGNYRLFYLIEDDKLIVAVIDFRHRQQAFMVD